MASMTMAASLMGGAMTKSPSPSTTRGSLIVAKASEGERGNLEIAKGRKEEGGSNGRRDLVFAAAAVAALSIAKIAVAEEPKRGSPEAKKKYAPVCVTMPTARICRN